jgi:hypothetical protein
MKITSQSISIVVLYVISTTATITTTKAEPNDSNTIQRIFTNCDIEEYYQGYKDGYEWKPREDIAILLQKTHRQIIQPSFTTNSARAGMIPDATISKTTSTWDALEDLDSGSSRGDGFDTVRMIFTQTDVAADARGTGWEPGMIWPIEETLITTNGDDNALLEAINDLHNIRPIHPNVHSDNLMKELFYGECHECFQDVDTEEEIVYTEDNKNNNNNIMNRERVNTNDRDSAAGQMCFCEEDHALQPPENARGEIARALLYMELRYGTPTTASDGLGLVLSDCHPEYVGFDSKRMGYFSQLVQWHLEYPPSEEEMQRNNKVCELYQGNRNPFVDFHEDSWSLLNFNAAESERCPSGPLDNTSDSNNQVGQPQEQPTSQEEVDDEEGRLDIQPPSSTTVIDPFCNNLMAGDINFFMVEPSNPNTGKTNDSFGLITLMDLPPDFELYVTDNAWIGNGFQKTEGTWKVRKSIL